MRVALDLDALSRRQIEDIIERLINLLDDEDDDADFEPSLGCDDDLEEQCDDEGWIEPDLAVDDEGCDPDTDREPDLCGVCVGTRGAMGFTALHAVGSADA